MKNLSSERAAYTRVVRKRYLGSRQIEKAQKVRHSFIPFAIAFTLAFVCSSCSTTRNIQNHSALLRTTKVDTCYVNTLRYDSIYVYEGRDFRPNAGLTEHTQADTLVLTQIQYRYKVLRDTLCKVQTDTIAVVNEVEVTKEVGRPETAFDRLCRVSFFILLGLLLVGLVLLSF